MAKLRLCSVVDCGNPSRSKGLCNMHYLRTRRTHRRAPSPIDTHWQSWLEGHASYSAEECLLLPSTGRYRQITVGGKRIYAHRFMCILAHGEPPTSGQEAAHSCGNGHLGCVAPSHLRWATHQENQVDRVVHGTSNRGERHGCAKLTEHDVRAIREMAKTISRAEIASKYGIVTDTVGSIVTRRSWAWLP